MKVCLKLISLICAAVLLMLCMTSCVGGDDKDTVSNIDSSQEVSSEIVSQEPVLYMNNLTGCYEFEDESICNKRPVAVMVNNLSSAQRVQTGLTGASIVYETMAEGGVTRLLAIYKDISSMGEIGTIRSARYSYVDLANGHDALYFHCGADPTYTVPYMNQLGIDDIDINTGKYGEYGYRFKNGLAYEHTMYTSGELIANAMADENHRTEKSDKRASLYEPWQNFADEEKIVKLSGGSATNVSVYFSASYVTSFKYDEISQRYVKSNKSGNNSDYRTGESLSYRNLLVLFDDVNEFADNYRVYSPLKSGTGYYFTNGTMMNISWSKGGTYDSFKITDAQGNSVEYTAGNSYVCIPPKKFSSRTTFS